METGLPGVESKRCESLFLQIYSELPQSISAYKQRMGIEEMFRDCKSGGYNLEGSGLRGDRLIKMILLMAIAYTWAIFQGTKIHTLRYRNMYLAAPKQEKTTQDGVHLALAQDGEQWVNYLEQHSLEIKRVNEVNSK